MSWQDYKTLRSEHTVVGNLRIQTAVYSPQLDYQRDILVWLPPDYPTSTRSYPVIYMHDGQNLFDSFGSYSGEWQVDETMTTLAAAGQAAIIVGLNNAGEGRRTEYNPYPWAENPLYAAGRGEDYIRFMVETVKPLIDRDFRTLPDVANTGIAGSSMGGLICLYGFLTRQDIFGFCGCFSPVFWIGRGLQTTLQKCAIGGGGKIYLDVGGQEGEVIVNLAPFLTTNLAEAHRAYLEGVRELRTLLIEQGYREGDNLLYVEDPAALHHEPAWAQRLPKALRFLLPET